MPASIAGDSTSDVAAGGPDDDVAARYTAPTGRRGRRRRVALITTGVLLAAAVFTWTAVSFSSREARWQDISSRPLGRAAMELTFEVYAADGALVRCVVRAVDRGQADVGQREVDLGPVAGGAARATVRITTVRPGIQASVRTCVVLPDQLP